MSNDREYIGPAVPRWFASGLTVRVVNARLLPAGANVARGERGALAQREGNGWWDWVVLFGGGRRVCVAGADEALAFAKVKEGEL